MTRIDGHMDTYIPPQNANWIGRDEPLIDDAYWYQIIKFVDLNNEDLDWSVYSSQDIVIIGYECDEGVKRNQGRPGSITGPQVLRKMLGSLPNHDHNIIDAGDVRCAKGNMEQAQLSLADTVSTVLKKDLFPIVIGGGHDIAYGHYNGIRKYLNSVEENSTIGIINLDAHFDLRSNEQGNNSGTPFFQIAEDCKKDNRPFHYLCLGIQRSSNTAQLFDTADTLGVDYMFNHDFHIENKDRVLAKVEQFIEKVDHIYLTIDLDGFSSAYAPGVSAPSPLGFSPDIAMATIEHIISSGKLISTDLAELNPTYDIDNHTARLASKLIHKLAGTTV